MGGASSVSIDNLSSHQTSEITRLMKEQYDNICKNQQLDNQQQYEKLVQRYNEIVEKVKNTPHYMLPKEAPKEAPKQSKIFHRSVSHAKDSGKKKTIGRRRSFENNKTSKLSKTESNASELQESQSSPVLPAIDPQGNESLLP